MNTMTWNGYVARVEFDDRDAVFVGRILGIADIVRFHGETVAELRDAFHEAVTDYLDTCARIGKRPDKPASGKLMLRVPQEVHQRALIAAKSKGLSLNQWAADVLARASA